VTKGHLPTVGTANAIPRSVNDAIADPVARWAGQGWPFYRHVTTKTGRIPQVSSGFRGDFMTTRAASSRLQRFNGRPASTYRFESR
jgi:hypothetical protein